jgi:AcrR family transcriptional regulator
MRRRYGRSRRDLAEAAIRQFEEKGFADTTIEDIAKTAGYTTRTFFRQFTSKEDVIFFDLPDILSPLKDLLREPPQVAWDAVSAILVKNSETWAGDQLHLALSRTRLLHNEPALYRRYLEISVEWEAVIVEVFAVERERNAVDDTYSQVLGTSVVGACRAAMRQWVADPSISLGERTSAGLELVRSGFSQQNLGAMIDDHRDHTS